VVTWERAERAHSRMTSRQINLALWTSAAIVGIAAAAVAFLGLWMLPASTAGGPGALKPITSAAAPGASATLPALDSFEPIWPKRIRRPLTDGAVVSASPAAVTPTAGQSSFPATLVGTIGTSLAMLQMPDGSIALKGVGDEVAGAEILAIRTAAIDVRYGGRAITLNKVNAVSTTGSGAIPDSALSQ
jgi:hypothetical protein